jgi:hypothetical protein
MKVPQHPEDLQNGTVIIDKQVRPLLYFYVIPGESSQTDNF